MDIVLVAQVKGGGRFSRNSRVRTRLARNVNRMKRVGRGKGRGTERGSGIRKRANRSEKSGGSRPCGTRKEKKEGPKGGGSVETGGTRRVYARKEKQM